jgi:hypothetical protein
VVVESPTVKVIAFLADTVRDAVNAAGPAVGGRAFSVCRVQVHVTLASAFAASLD